MPQGRTALVCERISVNKKTWTVTTGSCRVTREGNGKSFVATLSKSALAHKRAVKVRRSREAKKRFAKVPKLNEPWKCSSTRVEGKNVIGVNCSRKVTAGFGGSRVVREKRVVLTKGR